MTDAGGNALAANQTTSGSGGSRTFYDAETSDVIATLTAHASGAQFQLPVLDTQVLHDAPTGLSIASFSAGEIDLSWIDHSPTASADFIYESTDLGVTFEPIDQVDAATPNSGNSYAATGLSPGTPYEFEVTADGSLTESAPTNAVQQKTPFVIPTLDAEGTGTVVEGQPYELDLTAIYPDGEPGAIDHWLVNWNDGPGGTSNVSTYTYASGADPTQPLAVFHTFAAGIASPAVTIQAVDTVNGTWSADPQAVAVTPIAPVLNSASASSNSIVVGWSNASSIATGTTVLLSTDDVVFFEASGATVGAVTTTITGLFLDTQYWVEVMTNSANGISPLSSAHSVHTPYVQPTLVVTAPYPATVGQQYMLDLSANYANGTPLSEQIDHWTVNWGDGSSATQTYNPGYPAGSPTYNDSAATDTIQVTGVNGNGNSIANSPQSVTFIQPAGHPDSRPFTLVLLFWFTAIASKTCVALGS